jgi:Fur family peroxide stress response transcriptional regulator
MAISNKRFKKRDAILAYLQSTDTHPSADMVFGELKPQIPGLSLGTVYRNLAIFREQGDVISVGTVNGSERFDGHTQPHIHFICDDCHQILDLHRLQLPEQIYVDAQREYGCSVSGCQLTVNGLCQACILKKKKGESA